MLFLVLEFSFQALYFNLQLDVLKSTQALIVINCHRPSVLEPGSYLSLALVHSFSSYPSLLHDPWHRWDSHGSVTQSRMNGLYSFGISPELLICSPKPFILAPGWWTPPKSVCCEHFLCWFPTLHHTPGHSSCTGRSVDNISPNLCSYFTSPGMFLFPFCVCQVVICCCFILTKIVSFDLP